MKKLLSISLAAILFTTAAFAQTERPTEAKPATEKQDKQDKKKDKLKMAKELGLTKEQMAQMKENKVAMKAKKEALKANDQITVKEMREKKAALKKEQEENMTKILTPEQKVKFDEMKMNKKKGHGKHKKDKKEVVS